jgi:peroxiredoxin
MTTTLKTFLMAIFFAMGISTIHAQSNPAPATEAKAFTPGMTAPGFELMNIDGNMRSLLSCSDKGVIVIFTCNHCPFAKAYEERIINLHNRYSKLGFPVVAINPNDSVKVPADSYTEMQKRAKEKNYPFPYLYDPGQRTATAYGARTTPQVYLLVNQGGTLILKYTGAIDDNADEPAAVTHAYVEEAIAKISVGQQPDPASTKAIGCSIKWASR